jgi:hypothetical protein
MGSRLRYGDLLSHVRQRQRVISFNDVIRAEPSGRRRYRLRKVDYYRLLAPYFGTRTREQILNVLPVVAALALFQVFLLRTPLDGATAIGLGIATIVLGLMFFLDGIKLGLMPLAENIGFGLPSRSPIGVVVAASFVLGILATLAEPAIGALQAAGSLVVRAEAPLLHFLLNDYSVVLVGAVAIGVGAAVVLANLRYLYNIRLKTLVILTLVPALALTGYLAGDPALEPVLGLAWDCGAITTGPVTVPLVLAIGIGLSAAAGTEDNPLSGFGIVTLASLFPAIAVMTLGLVVTRNGAPAEAGVPSLSLPAWSADPAVAAVIGAVRAVVPLILFLLVLQRFILRAPLGDRTRVYYGMAATLLGMVLFNLGLAFGLSPLGSQAGEHLPSAFVAAAEAAEALYPYWVGLLLVLAFAFLVGFGATMAEPALSAMGLTVETLTDGAFPRRLLVRTVAFGVAAGMAVGVTKILFHVPIAWLLLPAYGVAIALTMFAKEEYVNLAWDSAGVTTGPVTVPLVLALGLGLGEAVGAAEGFGVLAMASVGPILSVLAVGKWIDWMVRRKMAADAAKEE